MPQLISIDEELIQRRMKKLRMVGQLGTVTYNRFSVCETGESSHKYSKFSDIALGKIYTEDILAINDNYNGIMTVSLICDSGEINTGEANNISYRTLIYLDEHPRWNRLNKEDRGSLFESCIEPIELAGIVRLYTPNTNKMSYDIQSESNIAVFDTVTVNNKLTTYTLVNLLDREIIATIQALDMTDIHSTGPDSLTLYFTGVNDPYDRRHVKYMVDTHKVLGSRYMTSFN